MDENEDEMRTKPSSDFNLDVIPSTHSLTLAPSLDAKANSTTFALPNLHVARRDDSDDSPISEPDDLSCS